MKFKAEKVNRTKLFSLGKDVVRDEYIMAIVIAGITWYEQYFSISKKEFELYDENIDGDGFIKIYDECFYYGSGSNRYLCSDKLKENTPKQLERLREGRL